MITLSVIIPVYNEALKIKQDILSAEQFLTAQGISGEIIVVDDGSKDNTASAAKATFDTIKTPCFLESLEHNCGKGRAVRTGILKSRGDYVLFADSGNCVPYSDAVKGIELIGSGRCKIAHGSRRLSDCNISRPQSVYRKICSALFHWYLVHDIKRVGNLTDTQCGFKVYDGNTARKLYALSTVDGFMFDIEIILLALAGHYNIGEFPVNWACDPDSRLKPMHESWHVFRDLIRLKKRFSRFFADNST